MPREARLKSRNGIYHIILRGANRQEIFHDDEDCIRFLDIIGKYQKKSEISIYAWCLMNNHVHLLLREGNEDVSITMKRIGVSYVHYYNWKYRTTGHLFQDRFRSENVETKQNFLRVVRYIHQNPVKAGIAPHVDEWRWSSCQGYYGSKSDRRILVDNEYIFRMFSSDILIAKERFKEFNEEINHDNCLDDRVKKRRVPDEEIRVEVKELLGIIEIAQVKSLPKSQRDEVLRKIKKIDGISQRQAARILGVSANLIFKA